MNSDIPHPRADNPHAKGDGADGTTHFGFRTVAENEKAGMVRSVFDAVAPKYDLMNDLMSAGVHRLWKSAMVDWLAPKAGQAIIDVAGGTGDIAFRMLDRMGEKALPVTICDINAEMLNVGRNRAIDQGRLTGVRWVCGNAESLPFPDMSFDAYTIAFGLRNVTHIDQALAEGRRVLKPGGRLICLEFSKVVVPVLDKLYDAYSFQVLPWLGGLVAGDRAAYRYLAESIRRFPDQNALARHMESVGFAQVKVRNLSGGIAAMHAGWRI
ncbi:MAG: bifunctional demethylmenaquinone methyltransferase/2-methoxy-6-polyprenyl-1,4-benzoquinol methylase UbiE [Rhodospirillaceae bacterium]|nr:bifunctional demethylmenaquinone methyltransferase/2-methoxy-6-polyprenyl-1,4-benzoquinol methylase UbiE [Rhodospirillaceae bacterium]